MGLFDSVKNFLSEAGKGIAKALNPNYNLGQPKGTVSNNVVPFAPEIPAVITGAQTIAKTIYNYPKTTVATAIGSLIGYGAIKENPQEALKVATETPSKVTSGLVNQGSNLIKFGEEPSFSNAFAVAKENPYLTAGETLGGIYLLKSAIYPALAFVSNLRNTNATNDNTNAFDNFVKKAGDNAFVDKTPTLSKEDQENLMQLASREKLRESKEAHKQNLEESDQRFEQELKLNEQQMRLSNQTYNQQLELLKAQSPAVVAPSTMGAPAVTKKKRKKKKKKAKKKTRRSKKKKKKHIKRRRT